MGDLLPEPLSPGHQGEFQMVLSILLQFLREETAQQTLHSKSSVNLLAHPVGTEQALIGQGPKFKDHQKKQLLRQSSTGPNGLS